MLPRGVIEVKGKGKMETFLLKEEGRAAELATRASV